MLRASGRLLIAALGGLALAACAPTGGSLVATCYGIAPTSQEIDQCAVTSAVPARQYQAERQATQTQMASDVRSACMSYGLDPGTALYRNCLVREADLRGGASYASHFTQPGFRYDQNGNRVDEQGYLIGRSGQRIGGKGYWIRGPGDEIVPPGTYVGPSALQAPPRQLAQRRF